ncbi:MAG: hypothetical protein FD180_2692 [Planctomycetota bacterium]|nr:MAG: hypothetical protein FD180_2692 [Planctomycetota bacterium]
MIRLAPLCAVASSVLALVVGRSPEDSRNVTQCEENMKKVGVFIAQYESKYRHYPASLADLKEPALISGDCVKFLVCPLDRSGDPCSYEYLHPVCGDAQPQDSISLYDRNAHPDGSRCVLYFSGRVAELAEAEFKHALAEQFARDREIIGDEIVKAGTAALDPALTARKREAAIKRMRILMELER